MRATLLRVALLTVSASALAGCDGKGKTGDAQRAVDSFNAGTAPFHLREFLQKSGRVRTCHVAPGPGEGTMLLAVVTESDDWLQATVEPEQPVIGQDITTGGALDPQTLAALKAHGETCAVSRKYGTVSLDSSAG